MAARTFTVFGPTSAVIEVSELTKVFSVPEREAGLRAVHEGLFRRRHARGARRRRRSRSRSSPGEVVGFLGPNGAGKTTTLKMLSGLLYSHVGRRPRARVTSRPGARSDYLRQITLVMGNRNQLQWDLPALDSFELNRAIYRLDREDFLPTARRDDRAARRRRPRPQAGAQPLARRAHEGRGRRLAPAPCRRCSSSTSRRSGST